MAEYIERETVVELFNKWADGYSYIEVPTKDAIARVRAIHAADVREVVHGHWRTIPMACYGGGTIREYECSVCEEHQVSESPFCPNCGARMDGDRDV